MKQKLLFSLLYFAVFLCALPNLKAEQEEFIPEANLIEKFKLAQVYLDAFENDSANIILTDLVNYLLETKELDSPFGLRVQLKQAEALEQDEQNELAIEKLLYITEMGTEKGVWDAVANAHLSLARLHEKIGRWEQCGSQLSLARNTINTNQLDSIFPRYAIRYSSYQRFYGDKDTALFYAQEVVRTSTKFNQTQRLAVGHLLLGMLLSKTDYKTAIGHHKQAGIIYKKLGDQTGYGYTHSNISNLYLANDKPYKALLHNDSALITAHLAYQSGTEDRYHFYRRYKDRAGIYHILNQPDSAWYYLNKGYMLELRDVKEINHQQVIEIDAKYYDAKKEKQILEQRQLLVYEKQRQYWLWGLILISILSISLLTRYYLRLRKANNKSYEQALIIKQANDELSKSLEAQITLQGEVHHRVKNNLQVIISLLELQMDEVKDPQALGSLEAMSNRIFSMAAIHEILYQRKGNELVNLKEYTEKLCLHYSNFFETHQQPVFKLDISDRTFNLATLIPLGVILNELLTNSFKYATRIGEQLKIGISLTDEQHGYCLFYQDNGPGFPEGKLEQREGSLGSYLLQSMSRQLKGRFVSNNENGAVAKVYFHEKQG